MAGLLGPLLEPNEELDLEQSWVANVRAQWRATGAYRQRPEPRTPTGPVLTVSYEEWWETGQRIFLAFNDVAAGLGLEARAPGSDDGKAGRRARLADGRSDLWAALDFVPSWRPRISAAS